MNARQEALERHGLTESPDGFELTAEGFRKASQRALELRRQGDLEAADILGLDPTDPLRWEFCRCLQIDSFTTEAHQAGI
ncbi:hypothetical protein [Streptomyces sp. NPDC003299]